MCPRFTYFISFSSLKGYRQVEIITDKNNKIKPKAGIKLEEDELSMISRVIRVVIWLVTTNLK
jgi:hypothetical protein